MEGWIFLVFLLFAALAIVGGYYSYLAQQKRITELSQLAATKGWRFDVAKDYSHDERYGHFSSFSSGDNGYAYNTITGAMHVGEGLWPVQLGDFHYETTSTSSDGKGNTTTKTDHHYLSYLIIETPHLGTPGLFIRREGFFDKIAGFLGFDDIDFESAEFSDRFIVKSSDKRFAYDVIHPRMMEYLLDVEPPTIDLQRGQCCLSLGEKCWSPAEFEATLAWAAAFFEHWPRHVTSPLS
jgi:hypothetical protein